MHLHSVIWIYENSGIKKYESIRKIIFYGRIYAFIFFYFINKKIVLKIKN